MAGAAARRNACHWFPSDLPDPDPLLRWNVEFRPRLDVERLVPGVEVPERAYHPKAARAVRVGRDLRLDRIRPLLPAPRLREGQEEALVAGQAVKHRRRLAAKRDLVGFVSDFQA